jgi:hypothetical protein
LFVVSVDEDMPLFVVEDVSVEEVLGVEDVVPLAPMLDVPVVSVLEELLGVDDVVPLAPMLDVLSLLAVLPALCDVVPVELLLLLVLDALVPPPAEPALAPPVCATAMPPIASAAAAARVVRVVFNMSCSP